jgi:hypothetical protein
LYWHASFGLAASGGFAFGCLRHSLIAGNAPANFSNSATSCGVTEISSARFNLSDRADATQLRLPSDQNSAVAALGPLSINNGGPTPTHALGLSSEARDGGSNDGSAWLIDQRGTSFRRPKDLTVSDVVGGDGTDVGAVEADAEELFANGFEG